MKKFTGVAIAVLCLVAVVVVCRYVEKQACEKRIQQVREELAPTPVPEVRPIEMRDLTVDVNFTSKPTIPYIEIPYTSDPNAPTGRRRLVTFRTRGGTAIVVVPVESQVQPASSGQYSPELGVMIFKIDQNGTTLEITKENTETLREVEYQIYCNDGTNQYWAEGQSPPRMQIPPV